MLEARLAFLCLAHLFGTLVGELAVAREALYVVVDVPVSSAGSVGVALLYELLYERDHLRYVLCGARLHVGEADAEHLERSWKESV